MSFAFLHANICLKPAASVNTQSTKFLLFYTSFFLNCISFKRNCCVVDRLFYTGPCPSTDSGCHGSWNVVVNASNASNVKETEDDSVDYHTCGFFLTTFKAALSVSLETSAVCVKSLQKHKFHHLSDRTWPASCYFWQIPLKKDYLVLALVLSCSRLTKAEQDCVKSLQRVRRIPYCSIVNNADRPEGNKERLIFIIKCCKILC